MITRTGTDGTVWVLTHVDGTLLTTERIYTGTDNRQYEIWPDQDSVFTGVDAIATTLTTDPDLGMWYVPVGRLYAKWREL